ncbi:MAG: hypothetical protein E6I40_04360 [Chloroflexi bacterium]|nr:MAG: hypothetical protein AUH67_00405 [Chloroflexi bacterium 13_1_40CM_4_69_19]TME96107.1 MAG: hypothetical protein E6I40_04360 [Chloroflexota bacterium]
MRIEELDGAAANWRPWEPPTWLVAFGLVLTLAFGVAHAEKAGGRTGGTHEGAPTQPGWVPPPHEIPCAVATPPPNANVIRWFACH